MERIEEEQQLKSNFSGIRKDKGKSWQEKGTIEEPYRLEFKKALETGLCGLNKNGEMVIGLLNHKGLIEWFDLHQCISLFSFTWQCTE